jgi:uncharacterized membrane protein YtjA (UPF0391 family)
LHDAFFHFHINLLILKDYFFGTPFVTAIRIRSALRSCSDVLHLSIHSGKLMLHYAVLFFVIALIAGMLGFTGIAGASVGIAKILFLVFIVLAVMSLLFGRRPSA